MYARHDLFTNRRVGMIFADIVFCYELTFYLYVLLDETYKQMKHVNPYIISFCSGKRSVGKSVIAANIGFLLAKSGSRVLISDADIASPNLHLIYGVEPRIRINDILEGNALVQSVIHSITYNLSLIAGISGQSSEVDGYKLKKILEEIIVLDEYESIIFDCNYGADNNVIECCKVSDMIIIIISDEPSSLIDGYGLIKILQSAMPEKEIRVIVNNVIDKEDADEAEQKLNRATAHFLSSEIVSLGFVPYDRMVKTSIMRQELLADFYSNSGAAIELRNIAHIIYEMVKSEIFV
jgi:flagellar biosynthesis protein FlhG